MSTLISAMNSIRKEISDSIDYFVKEIFEYRYPHKLKKFHGKKIIPLYDWTELYHKGVDRFFDYLPAEKTDSLPKFYHLSMRDEMKLKAWYRDYFGYVAKLEHED